jgi:two-component system, NarL family, response regulator DesR
MSWLLLLVDDHRLFREALALLLKWQTGFDIVQAGSVAEAQRVLGGSLEEVGLAFIDIDLPGGDGIELIEELREADTDVPVLALATGRRLQRTRALQAGAEEVLSVEAPIEELIGAVRRLLAASVEPEENSIRDLV